MKFTILLLFLCLFFSFSSFAQSPYSVKGTVSDSSSNARLANTTIMVLNAKDSTLRDFTRATASGSFSLNKLSSGQFILSVSFPGYANYVEPFTLSAAKTQHDFGKIYLILKARLLKEVMIKGTVAAIKIKGDTTVFDPRAYVIQPNSKVEDLLKQLPGMQVDKDGKITAQGQAVGKVLVDGEEFFGDDPTLVTKNIRGDMVDKVQLYDKKSDQAAFTGVDDGQKTKTINIQLKADKKNGYFGKLDGSYGTDKYYQEQALYNKFQGKKKFSAYGITANTGKVGLGWEDSQKLGTGSDDGVIFFSSGDGSGDLDSFDGRYNNQGIPLSYTGGLHYDSKWDKDDKTMNTNYKASSLEVDGTKNNQVQNNLPGRLIHSNSDQTFNNKIFRQKLDFMYQVRIDTTATLKFTIDGTVKNSKNNTDYSATSRNGGDTLLNRNNRNVINNVDGQIFNASVLYNRKLKKPGRTISASAYASVNNSDAKGFLNSEIDFYNKTTGARDSVQLVDQYKTTLSDNAFINTNLSYNEPITKKLTLSLNYGIIDSHSNSDRRSYNKVGNYYTALDAKYSNDYTLNQFTNQFGASLNYRTQKATIFATMRGSDVNFDQTDEMTGIHYKRDFLNLSPYASYQYRFSQQKSLRFGYNGYTNQPSIDQIQPIRVNTDPLNITLGNPDLKPSFRHSFNLNYNSYKVLTDQSVYISGNYGFTENQIVSNTVTDTTGKSTFQSVNLKDHTPINYNLYASLGRKLGKSGIGLSLDLNGSGSKSYSYSNSALNTTTSGNFSAQLGINRSQQKKYDFRIGAGPGYALGKSSLQPNSNNNGYTFGGYGYFNLYLPGKVQINSTTEYQYKGKTQAFDQTFSKVIINSGISKTFLKQDNLKFTITGNDLLNQNQGFDRNSFNGTITQNTYTTIKRYILFSLTWDFSKMGGAPEPKK